MIIYKVTNTKNGKVYIGQTRRSLAKRKSQHLTRALHSDRNHKLYLAMRKYGVESFKFEEICSVLSPEYLNELEAYFIAKYDSFRRGYNMTEGGDSVSEATAYKISLAKTGKSHPMPKGESHRSSRFYRVQFPDGHVEVIRGWRAFCLKHLLNQGNFSKTLAGQDYTHTCKGFKLLERLNDYPVREYAQVGGSGKQAAATA